MYTFASSTEDEYILPGITATRNVYSYDGTFDGVIGADFIMDELQDLLYSDVDEGYIFFVIDDDGYLVTSCVAGTKQCTTSQRMLNWEPN